MTSPFVRPTTGPGTREIFYESGALTLAAVVSGAALIDCVQSATGNNQMHATPLEARFCGELAHAAEGMTRKDADPIVTWLVEKYRHIQSEGLVGQPFPELYDLDTLQPTNKWYQEYDNVCKEIEAQFGIELT